MSKKICVVCGKVFDGKCNARFCSEECRNTPIYTDEFNNQKFGELIIEKSYRKAGKIYSICKCSCGNIRTIRFDDLQSGATVSCGHKAQEQMNKSKSLDLAGKVNKYGCIAIKRLEKKNKSLSYLWLCKCPACGKEFSVPASAFPSKQSCGCLRHEFNKIIMKKANNVQKQFYLNDTSVISISNNKLPKNNKSGIKGVYQNSRNQKGVALIEVQKKKYFLGEYKNIEDAAKARKDAEDAMFGDFLKWFKETYPERWEKLNKNRKMKE